MHTHAASTARRTKPLPQDESRWNRLVSWLKRRKEYLLLELLSLLEPNRPRISKPLP